MIHNADRESIWIQRKLAPLARGLLSDRDLSGIRIGVQKQLSMVKGKAKNARIGAMRVNEDGDIVVNLEGRIGLIELFGLIAGQIRLALRQRSTTIPITDVWGGPICRGHATKGGATSSKGVLRPILEREK